MVPHAPSAPRLPRRLKRGVPGAATAVAALVLIASAACDKVPLTAPAGTVITLVASTNVLPINGTTDLIAVLIENGTTGTTTGGAATPSAGTPVHNGTLVTFTTSLGRIEPAEARTSNGRVTVKLVADGRSGTATITAFSGSASKALDVKIGAAAAERVAVTASSATVPANGGTVTISARVEDISGNPLTGVPVSFTTTGGTLSAGSALTNENGVATTSLSTTTAAKVTASAGGKTGTADIAIRSRSEITLGSPSGSVFVGAAAAFTVTPDPAVAFKNVTIDFGDGESRSLGAISSTTTVVHFYTEDGVFQVTVVGTDVDGGTAEAWGSVAVIPFTFSAGANPTSGPVTTIFTLSVTGIPASVPIERYEWSFGDGTGQTTNTGSTTHGYQTVGLKTITVTIVPRYGSAVSTTFQLLVTGP
jgi:hypothetical protein